MPTFHRGMFDVLRGASATVAPGVILDVRMRFVDGLRQDVIFDRSKSVKCNFSELDRGKGKAPGPHA